MFSGRNTLTKVKALHYNRHLYVRDNIVRTSAFSQDYAMISGRQPDKPSGEDDLLLRFYLGSARFSPCPRIESSFTSAELEQVLTQLISG